MVTSGLRTEVEAAASKAYANATIGRVKKSAIVEPFLSRGVGRSTLYRWVDHWVEERKPGQMTIRAAQRAAAVRKHRATVNGESPEKAAAKLAAKMIAQAAVLPAIEVVAAPGMTTATVVRRLQSCIEAAEQVMAFARKDDGTVKMPKTLLAGSEHLRRSLETAVKLHEAMRTMANIEQFHDELIGLVQEVAKEYPPAAELLLNGMRRIAARWRG